MQNLLGSCFQKGYSISKYLYFRVKKTHIQYGKEYSNIYTQYTHLVYHIHVALTSLVLVYVCMCIFIYNLGRHEDILLFCLLITFLYSAFFLQI